MMEYLANLNDMCVINVMQCEEERLRHVTVTAELEETLCPFCLRMGAREVVLFIAHSWCLSETWVWCSPRYESTWFARPR